MSRHLVARFRHLRAAADGGLHLDWERLGPHRGWRALLENGDHVYAYAVGENADQWGYVLYGPKAKYEHNPNLPDGDKSFQRFTVDDEGVYSEILGGSGPTPDRPDADSAMHDAESHYFGLGRRGQAPAHDLDYGDLVNPRQEIGDEDFGDIFGDGDIFGEGR